MNYSDFMGFVAGALQLAVAVYSLRLNRLFGPRRVGLSLFFAFLLLALLHLVQSVSSLNSPAKFGIGVNATYTLVSLLLLTGMIHLESILKERQRKEGADRQRRAELEQEVHKKTAYLVRAIEQLQAEMDERKRMKSEIETAHWELRAVSGQVQTAQMANDVLHGVEEMLKSVSVSADLVSSHVKQSKIANAVRAAALLREHGGDLNQFITRDPRGQKLAAHISQLTDHLATEQTGLMKELDTIKKNLEKIASLQQDHLMIAGENISTGGKNEISRETRLETIAAA